MLALEKDENADLSRFPVLAVEIATQKAPPTLKLLTFLFLTLLSSPRHKCQGFMAEKPRAH